MHVAHIHMNKANLLHVVLNQISRVEKRKKAKKTPEAVISNQLSL